MRRLKKLEKYINNITIGGEFYISANCTQENLELAEKIGIKEDIYSIPWSNGSKFLAENIQGKKYIDKNSKESYFRDIHWVTKDYQGNTHEGVTTYTAYRYRRYYDVPLCLKFSIVHNQKGDKLIISEKLLKNVNDYDKALLYINIFRELFGTFIVTDNSFNIPCNVNHLNWVILKPGESLFEYTNRINTKQKHITNGNERSFKFFTNNKKVETFVGTQSFQGYVAFVYEDYDFVILESLIYDNATYVIVKEDWIEVTKLSKKEVFNSKYIVKRIIHNGSWKNNIDCLFE